MTENRTTPEKRNPKKKIFLIINMLVTFVMLVGAVLTGISLELPLAVSLVLFGIYGWFCGNSWKEVGIMILRGAKKSMVVVQVMLVIGMLTASWFISGTIPYLVCIGIRIITPQLFILCAFCICAAVSVTIGTSFGTANTLGVVLMVIAKGSGVSPAITAGAIISGIFVGDRCSPMSSSLVLLSTVTKTDLYDNSKMCFQTIAVPAAASMVLYGILSFLHPMRGEAGNMAASIGESFVLNPWLLIPIAVIFGLCLKKVPIKITMVCSIITAVVLAFVIQKEAVTAVLYSLIFGFALPEGTPSAEIMHGGGFMSMVSTCIVVLLSCMITEILEETRSLEAFTGRNTSDSQLKCYAKTLAAGCASAAISCNQTAGIIMTEALREPAYEQKGSRILARDLSIAGSIIPAMVPWSIAVYTPVHSIGYDGMGYYPYTFLLWGLVLWGAVLAWRESR